MKIFMVEIFNPFIIVLMDCYKLAYITNEMKQLFIIFVLVKWKYWNPVLKLV